MEKGVNLAIAKWAGGKRQLLSQLEPLFPKKFNNYHEPFVGGGAVAFYIIKTKKPKKFFLSDINEELINVYEVVKDNLEELIDLLKIYKIKHTKQGKEFYTKVRSEDIEIMSKLSRAARFIYLNRTCFNGLYRVNSKGEFNVPMGKYENPGIVQEKELNEISKLLKKVEIKFQSFEKILPNVKKGDFVYLDPPYYPLNKSSFTTYAKDNFLEEEHKKLFDLFVALDKKGAKVMLSNSNAKFILDLYSKYETKLVHASRMINCNAEKRGKVKEVVIMNY
ncbi:MAG TPA: DNA adenine methylase [Candidatus Nanoarchaeia archaeon]|nr:DNA adenine methylase [Candidatus Nanoarchaeia archaeon]